MPCRVQQLGPYWRRQAEPSCRSFEDLWFGRPSSWIASPQVRFLGVYRTAGARDSVFGCRRLCAAPGRKVPRGHFLGLAFRTKIEAPGFPTLQDRFPKAEHRTYTEVTLCDTALHSCWSNWNSSSMCSLRVRKLTGLMRNQDFPFNSVVEIQKRPLCSTRFATSACNSLDSVSPNAGFLYRTHIADIGGLLAGSNSESASTTR